MSSPQRTPASFAAPLKTLGHKARYVLDRNGEVVDYRDVITGIVRPDAAIVLDAFGGTMNLAAMFKRAGRGTIACDIRPAATLCGQAIVVNDGVTLDDGDAEFLTRGDLTPGPMHKMFGQLLGGLNMVEFDRILRNSWQLAGPCAEMKRLVSWYGMLHVVMAAMDRFHLHLSSDRGSLVGNEHIACGELAPAWRHWVLCDHPRLVFSNGHPHVCLNGDIVDLMPGLQACCGYFDPSYPCGGSSHPYDLKLLDDMCAVFEGKPPGDAVFRSARQPRHRFDSRDAFLGNMAKLLIRARHIGQWIISLNTSSKVRPEEVQLLVKALGRTCRIHRFAVPLPTCIPRMATDKNHECLLDCRAESGAQADLARIEAELDRLAKGCLTEVCQ